MQVPKIVVCIGILDSWSHGQVLKKVHSADWFAVVGCMFENMYAGLNHPQVRLGWSDQLQRIDATKDIARVNVGHLGLPRVCPVREAHGSRKKSNT